MDGREKTGAEKPEYKISESEWQLMEVLWEEGELTQPQIMAFLGKKWNRNTVHTFLTRLDAKGFLEVDKERSPHVYRALVSREACEKQERQSFLERVYQGSVSRMVASFVKDSDLKPEEVQELKKILDGME